MSDNQRRVICRLVFMMTCFAPTALVVYWLLHPQTPAQWETLMQAQLGVATSVVSIETPGPRVTVLRGVEISDPEFGKILDAMEIRIEHGTSNYVTIPHSIQTTNAGLIQLVKSINDHFIRAHAAQRPWRIQFLDHVVIQDVVFSGQSPTDFPKSLIATDVEIDISPEVEGTTAELSFRIPELDPEKMILCQLKRSHFDENQQSLLRLQLATNDVAVPCWLIADLVPEVAQLGPDCCFAGNLDLNPRSGNPYGWFAGKFSGIRPEIDQPSPGDAFPATPSRQTPSYVAEVLQCSLDGGVKEFKAYLQHPDGTNSPLNKSVAVVEQFDALQSLKAAVVARQNSRVESKLR